IPSCENLECSKFYITAAVSDIPQKDFLNAVCRFLTSLGPIEIFKELEKIEILLGKIPKDKNAPRIIDLDLLFYGNKVFYDPILNLTIPHPRWKERSFVLEPLAELVGDEILYSPMFTFI